MVAIWGPNKGSIIISQVFPCEKTRPVCEYDVVFGETFFRNSWRRNDEDRTGAEVEEEYRAMLLGKFGKSAMKRFL